MRLLGAAINLKMWARGWIYCTILLFTLAEDKRSTELVREARADERPLLLATLGGGMVAVHPATGDTIWKLKDEPVVKVPSQEDGLVPQFLPDPRHGSLYMYGPRAGEPHVLKKLPFTIPELVANAPCRSTDGILYTGKKSDTWFIIDPQTGFREHVSGFDKTKLFNNGEEENTCSLDKKKGVYLARTEYTVLMHNPRSHHEKWNVTFYDYSSHDMAQDMLNHYGLIHFTSTSNGRVMSFDRQTGDLVWSCSLDTPVVAAYLLDRDGLISVPFNSIGDDTMDHIMDDVKTLRNGHGLKNSNMELFPTLYIGEHNHGLYALSSLVDKNTITISTEQTRPLLLEGPMNEQETYKDRENLMNDHFSNVHYRINDLNLNTVPAPFLLLGHYKMPELTTNWLPPAPDVNILVRNVNYRDRDGGIRLINGQVQTDGEHDNDVENETKSKGGPVKQAVMSVGVQGDEQEAGGLALRPALLYRQAYVWLHQQENKGLKVALIVLVGLVITLFWYLQNQAREFQHLSQGGSRGSGSSGGGGGGGGGGEVTAQLEELGEGEMRIGRITFHTDRVLGKGCEGTFVYRGTFDKRAVAVKRLLPECFSFADREVALLRESDAHAHVVRYYCTERDKQFRGTFDKRAVAVKRLLPECFSFADREVALLRESDAHAHVVRYYCTERDKQFRYIALELCAATLQDYVEKKLTFECSIDPLDVLRQATMGLAHLHSVDIVHRDIKPHNVLLSVPTGSGEVRAMISDFGLSKKLHVGRTSFSRRSGVTGTDGWIAPEIINGERTTTSVDIFSLGCVFYYVLSHGRHPFGDVLRRQANILGGDLDLQHIDTTCAQEDVVLTKILIRAMISARPYKRPPCNTVLKNPIFWSAHTRLNFLQDVSDLVEGGGGGRETLEAGARGVVRGDWRAHVCERVAADLRTRRTYNGRSVLDLLRALRNKKHHYRELEAEVRESLGKVPEGFVRYWLCRFPLLLPHVWCQLQEHRHEDSVHAYYPHIFTFQREDVPELAHIDDYEPPTELCDPDRNQLFLKSRLYYDEAEPKKNYRRGNYSPRKVRAAAQDGENDGTYRHPHYNEALVRRKQKRTEDTPTWTLPPQ